MDPVEIRHKRLNEQARHAVALDEALRKKLLGEAARQREADEYLHHHPLAPGTPMPRSPPSETVDPSEAGDAELAEAGEPEDEYEIVEAISGEDNILQSSAEPTASSAVPGAATTSAPLPVGAEIVHIPTSIVPSGSQSASHVDSANVDAESTQHGNIDSSNPEEAAKDDFIETLLHRSKSLKGAIPRSLLPAACDLTDAQLKSYLANLDVPSILGNAQPGRAAAAARQSQGQTNEGGQEAPPPPMRPRRYHIEKRRRIPQLRERIRELTEQRDGMLDTRGHSAPPEMQHGDEQAGQDAGEQRPGLQQRSRSQNDAGSETTDGPMNIRLRSPSQQSDGSETLVDSASETEGREGGMEHNEEEQEEDEEDRLLHHLHDLNEEIHRLSTTVDKLEKVKDPAMPLSLQLGKNRSASKGKPDDELWSELTGRAPGVRRFDCYGNVFDLERHVLSPAMSERSEVSTISPMSSIDGLSIASSRSARSARSTSSGKLRRDSRSILQALEEAPPEDEASATAIVGPTGPSQLTQAGLSIVRSDTPVSSDMEEWKRDVERWTKTASSAGSSVGPPALASDEEHQAPSAIAGGSRQAPNRSSRLTDDELASRHSSLSSKSTLASSTLSFPVPTLSPNGTQRNKKPPAAMKTRRDLVSSSREGDEWSGRLSVSKELELAGANGPIAASGGLRRIAEAILPESTMVMNAVPANQRQIDQVVVPSEGDDFVESTGNDGQMQDAVPEATPVPVVQVEGESSTTPANSPPPLPRSPSIRDVDIPEIRVERPSTPASASGQTQRMSRSSSSPGQQRRRRTVPAAGSTLELPLTEKQAVRKAKEEARQAVWAGRHASLRAREGFQDKKDDICSRMFQTRDEGVKGRAHWELAELYIRYSDTLGVPAGVQGTKMMQEVLQRYEDLKQDSGKWARYAQMHVWLRRNGNGANGGEQHLTLACNAFEQAARLAGEKSEFAGHCYMLAARALQEMVRSPRQYHEAQSYWRKSVQAACATGLDERYANMANCCDLLTSQIIAGRYEGEAQAWRAYSIDAMQRAVTLSPDNADWKTRLSYYQACADDEGQLAAEEAEQQAGEEEDRRADDGHESGDRLRPGQADEDGGSNSAYSHVREDSDAFAIRQAMLRRVEGVDDDEPEEEEEVDNTTATEGDGEGEEVAELSTQEAPALAAIPMHAPATPSIIMQHSPTVNQAEVPSPVITASEASQSPERPMANPVTVRDGQFLDMDDTTVGTTRSHPAIIARDFGTDVPRAQQAGLADSPIFGSDMADEEAGQEEGEDGDDEEGLPLAAAAMIPRPATTQSLPNHIARNHRRTHSQAASISTHSSAPPSIDTGFLLETLKEHHRAILQTNEALSALTQSIHNMNNTHENDFRELRSEIRRDRELDRQETREMLQEHRNEQRTVNVSLEERMAALQVQMGVMQDRQDVMERMTPASSGAAAAENLAATNANRQETLERLERRAPGPSSPRTLLRDHQLRFASGSGPRRSSLEGEGRAAQLQNCTWGSARNADRHPSPLAPRPRSVPPSYNPNRHSIISNDPPPSFHSRADAGLGNSFGLTGMHASVPPMPSTGVLAADYTQADNDALLERGAYLFGMYALQKIAQNGSPRR